MPENTNPDFVYNWEKLQRPIGGQDLTNDSPIDPWTRAANPNGQGTIRVYKNIRVRHGFHAPDYRDAMIAKLAADLGPGLVGEFALSGDFDTAADTLGREFGYVAVAGVSVNLGELLALVASGNDLQGNQIYSADKYQLGVPTDWKLVRGKFAYTLTPPDKRTAEGPPGVLSFVPALR